MLHITRRSAAVTLSTIAAAVLTVAVSAPAANAYTNYYGAIAVSSNGATGRAWDYSSETAASNAAESFCGYTDCESLTTFVNGCGAIAYDGSTYQGGRGDSLWEAQRSARSRLGGGTIVSWVCTTGHS